MLYRINNESMGINIPYLFVSPEKQAELKAAKKEKKKQDIEKAEVQKVKYKAKLLKQENILSELNTSRTKLILIGSGIGILTLITIAIIKRK